MCFRRVCVYTACQINVTFTNSRWGRNRKTVSALPKSIAKAWPEADLDIFTKFLIARFFKSTAFENRIIVWSFAKWIRFFKQKICYFENVSLGAIWNWSICWKLWPKMASKLKVELLKQRRLIFLSKGLVRACNYDKKDCTIGRWLRELKSAFNSPKLKEWRLIRKETDKKKPKISSTVYE